jgi:hypothetical protein
MEYGFKKPRKPTAENISRTTSDGRMQSQNDFVTIEVVCLKDMPLIERHKQANQPLYLARYE